MNIHDVHDLVEIIELFLTRKKLVEYIGIKYSTFTSKVNGFNSFNEYETEKISAFFKENCILGVIDVDSKLLKPRQKNIINSIIGSK